MASWKKVLVSGSSIEVNEITASGVPTLDNESNLLAIDATTGGITQITQAQVNAGNTYFIGGADTGSVVTNLSFDTSTDYLIYTGAFDHGFGFSTVEASNTASIKLHTPQALKTTSSPTFNSLYIDNFIFSKDNLTTRIEFIGNERIGFEVGGLSYLVLSASNSGEEIIFNDEGGAGVDLRVEGDTNTHLLFTDAGEDKVAIGTPTVNANSLLTVDGTIHTAGITASALPSNAASTTVIVNAGSGQLETRDIDDLLADGNGLFNSGSINGTDDEIEVTYPVANETKIGIVTNPILTGNVGVAGNLSASGDITASNIQLFGDLALGGNIFSFNGFSFIEGVSAVFTGSNIFGSGSTPLANDEAGGGVAHQFTGSVAITGSNLTIISGGITATENTGSFGYLTALEISSSGLLFASLSNDDSTLADGVVVYDNATGQFFTTASNAVGVTEYPDLNLIPAGILSSSFLNSPGQGEVRLTSNSIQGPIIDLGLQTSDSPQFVSLNLTGNLTASGVISGSSMLFASLSLDSTTQNRTVTYNAATGKFFHTGSYGGGGGGGDTNYDDLLEIPEDIISGSVLSSAGQGSVILTTNGVATNITADVGLETSDSPQFVDLTLTGNGTIAGNLTVNGDLTSISTTNMVVEDTFILLASGSQNADNDSPNDGGIIVERTNDQRGTALFWDSSALTWAIDVDGADSINNSSVNSDVNVATIQLNNGAPSAGSTPVLGVNDSNTGGRLGNLFVDASDDFGVYVYV